MPSKGSVSGSISSSYLTTAISVPDPTCWLAQLASRSRSDQDRAPSQVWKTASDRWVPATSNTRVSGVSSWSSSPLATLLRFLPPTSGTTCMTHSSTTSPTQAWPPTGASATPPDPAVM